MFFKEGRRPTDDAAAAFAAKSPEEHRADLERGSAVFAGQQAYWRCAGPETPAHYTDATQAANWQRGWHAAACEAARTFAEHRPMITHAPLIRSAMRDAGDVLRQIREGGYLGRAGYRLVQNATAAAVAINTAIVHSAPAAPTNSAAIDAPPGSAPARRESPAPTESGGAPGGASTDGSACSS